MHFLRIGSVPGRRPRQEMQPPLFSNAIVDGVARSEPDRTLLQCPKVEAKAKKSHAKERPGCFIRLGHRLAHRSGGNLRRRRKSEPDKHDHNYLGCLHQHDNHDCYQSHRYHNLWRKHFHGQHRRVLLDDFAGPLALSYRASNVTTLANGTQVTENGIPAFEMGTGSSMELCLEYTDAFPNPPYLLTPTITAFQWASCYPTCNSPPARNFTTNGSPVSILFSQGQSIVVEYTISVGENSTGFVGLWEGYYLECTPIPVAVGYPSSQVNASDFPGYGSGAIICPPSPVEVQIIGYTGGSLLYLAEENRG
jgi:hypothetical protein